MCFVRRVNSITTKSRLGNRPEKTAHKNVPLTTQRHPNRTNINASARKPVDSINLGFTTGTSSANPTNPSHSDCTNNGGDDSFRKEKKRCNTPCFVSRQDLRPCKSLTTGQFPRLQKHNTPWLPPVRADRKTYTSSQNIPVRGGDLERHLGCLLRGAFHHVSLVHDYPPPPQRRKRGWYHAISAVPFQAGVVFEISGERGFRVVG